MATADNDGAQTIEELQARYQKLQQEKIRAEANRENAEKQLSELKEEARETYGTDDIEELRKKLKEMRAENEKKRADYQAHLEKIESDLSEVEAKFGGDEPDGGEG
ncbi:MAG: hypothetical protein GVY14_15775 [Spirochaetes bacterium]|jgi:predicted  nucleic acid-binding Zn-ribbon protein|nr:hypothetical protein [Spirochaetota bacterium]